MHLAVNYPKSPSKRLLFWYSRDLLLPTNTPTWDKRDLKQVWPGPNMESTLASRDHKFLYHATQMYIYIYIYFGLICVQNRSYMVVPRLTKRPQRTGTPPNLDRPLSTHSVLLLPLPTLKQATRIAHDRQCILLCTMYILYASLLNGRGILGSNLPL